MKRLPWWKKPYFAHRVLEIGPGHNPFEGVTHVLERDVTDGRERGGNPLIVPTAAKLIVGEATVLPFAAASFDYVYASHVLEHVEDPASACAEIMRVAKAGYIETPSPFLEQGLALRDETSPEHWFHRWFVFSPSPGLLVFEPKSVEDVRRFCSCSDSSYGNSMNHWISAKPSIFFDAHRKPRCSIGTGRSSLRRATTSSIAARKGNHAASRA
jgi:SAM-dependent methyltransferase